MYHTLWCNWDNYNYKFVQYLHIFDGVVFAVAHQVKAQKSKQSNVAMDGHH
jgi:hypothetical protein